MSESVSSCSARCHIPASSTSCSVDRSSRFSRYIGVMPNGSPNQPISCAAPSW